ncbi:hypothetical protein [Streptomyces sp. NPDC060031]|uniref:hypothetical protein n=1 Tax=Streptomyces sp. NPDC060031 TaxID=3347043 RepID=UPI0036AA85E3
MSALPDRSGTSRRALNAKKRQSRRPSRLGLPAGGTVKPDRVGEPDAGFPGLLQRVWQQAAEAPDLTTAVGILASLDGFVPADVQLRALRTADEVALKVLCAVTWREDDPYEYQGAPEAAAGEPVFLGEIGLTTSGRIVVRVPGQSPLSVTAKLVAGVLRVPWSARAVADYHAEISRAADRFAQSVADCRDWLRSLGPQGRDEALEALKEAAQRTAPFMLYQEDRQYTNFRDGNTVTGKTLWPGHPDCFLSALQGLPLELWPDSDAVMVTCLTLLIRSAGYARIEEANGTQLSLEHVAYQLEQNRRHYNDVPGGEEVARPATASVADLDTLARALFERRKGVLADAQLYREIHGALVHKIERVAEPYGDEARAREAAVTARLTARLPLAGADLDELGDALAAAPQWLAEPHGQFGTGLESLVYEAVAAATDAFDADFSMSRGLRSLPRLIEALRGESWAEIVDWGITEFFCCVVPRAEARTYFADSSARLADTAWAMSSRMQYNSWHFIAGNLPKTSEIEARDHFVPPTIPDIAFYSDQHHHGHVNNMVRFTVRSPHAVEVLDRKFNGFMDLRLLRCEGAPFSTQDMLAAHRTSEFIAKASSLAAGLAAAGADIEVTSFDSQWHWDTVMAAAPDASEESDTSDQVA